MQNIKNNKERYAKEYFNDIKIKYLKAFKSVTPEGFTISGVICKKPNQFLGSMVIDSISFEDKTYDVEQFVHAMPKIHYYSYKNEMCQKEDAIWHCYEKLDGSCLILYGLYDDQGNLLEVVPKTRGVPVADKHIVEMYNEIDHSNIYEFFKHHMDGNPVLLFELYGTLNKHSIYYPEVRISMALIGMANYGMLQDDIFLDYISQQYDFKRPNTLFSLKYNNGFWRIIIHPGIYAHYLTKDMTEPQFEGLRVEYPTQLDAINTIKEYLDIINNSYLKVHDYSLTEGVCVNTYDSTGDNFMYLKIKPSKIEEKARGQEGIPRKFIIKETHKYFDEYGSQAKEIYKKDEDHAYNFVMENLSEEFSKDLLENKRTKKRVRSIFLTMLEAKEPPKGLQEICNELVEQYPNQDAVDYIRLFAQEYPEKKRQARMAFSIFEKLAQK